MLWSHISCFINCSGFSVNQLSIWRVDCRLELMCGHSDCKNKALKLKLKHSLLDIQHYNNIDGKRVIIIPLRLPIFLFKILPNFLFFTLFPKVMRGELFFSHLKNNENIIHGKMVRMQVFLRPKLITGGHCMKLNFDCF